MEEGLGVQELNLFVASSSNEIRSSDNKLMIKINQVKHALCYKILQEVTKIIEFLFVIIRFPYDHLTR